MTTDRTSTMDPSTDPLRNDYVTAASGTEQHPLVEAGEQAGDKAGHLAERATDLGFQQADRGREQAAEGVDQLADTIRRVSTELGTEQPAIANVASTAAEQAERVATYLRSTDAREILSNVEDMARRQPIVFLGGAFLLGVAFSRFIKAAAPQQGGQDETGYRSGYSTSYASGMGGYEATGPGTRSTGSLTGDEGI